MLAEAGREIAVLGLRRIESMDRRVDVDDLFALAYVFKIAEPYPVTPSIEASANTVREWIRGEDLLSTSVPGSPFRNPAPVEMLGDIVRWMPKDRARRVAKRYLDDEES